MSRKKISEKEKQEHKDEHVMRTSAARADRRSGKSVKREGKVSKSRARTKESRSSKKIAAIKKRTRS